MIGTGHDRNTIILNDFVGILRSLRFCINRRRCKNKQRAYAVVVENEERIITILYGEKVEFVRIRLLNGNSDFECERNLCENVLL